MSGVTTVYIVPGTAFQPRITGAADQNGVLLDNTTGAGVCTATAQDGAGAQLVAPPFLWEGSGGNFHGNVYGQYLVAANLPVRVLAQVTSADGSIVRAQQEWSVQLLRALSSAYPPGQPHRVSLTGVLFNGATPPAGWTAKVTVVDKGGRGVTQVTAAPMLITGPDSAQYDIAASVMVAKGDLLITAQAFDLGGNSIYAAQWRKVAEW